MATAATYTPGHSASVTDFMARRTVESHAAFVLPHVQRAWRALDIGCGPGTITVGLAARMAYGSVLGIDMNAAQVERARELARERGTANATFEVATLETLSLPASSFDLVFAHAVFEHVGDPVAVLRRLFPLLRPGGMIALRSPEWGGLVVHPDGAAIERALAAYERLQQGNGGDLRAGRKLGGWLEEAGFAAIVRSASYQIYDDVGLIASYLGDQLGNAGQPEEGAVLRAWARRPGSVFAQAWFEAMARRPGR